MYKVITDRKIEIKPIKVLKTDTDISLVQFWPVFVLVLDSVTDLLPRLKAAVASVVVVELKDLAFSTC